MAHSIIATVGKRTHQLGELNSFIKDCPFKELWRINLLMMDVFNQKEPTNSEN